MELVQSKTPRSDSATRGDSRKIAQHAEARFLAHWDEFVEHRKEVQARFDEIAELTGERREVEMRLTRACQQLEAKVDRCARQEKELTSRSDSVEDRIGAHAKTLDSHQEASDGIRERHHRISQDLSSVASALRSEIEAAIDQERQSTLDAVRHGDRCVADELLRKMSEFNEKLGVNILGLEQEVAAEMHRTRAMVLEVQTSGDAALAKSASDQSSEMESKVAVAASSATAAAARLESHINEVRGSATSAQAEATSWLSSLETKTVKLHEGVVRVEDYVRGVEKASSAKADLLREQIDEVSAGSAANLLRARAEMEQHIRESARVVREELRQELHEEIQRMREEMELRATREDLRNGIAGCNERAQREYLELRSGLSEVQEEMRTVCREMVDMVKDVHGQVVDARSEHQQNLDSSHHRLRGELTTSLGEVRAEHLSSHRSAREDAEKQSATLADTVAAIHRQLEGHSSSMAGVQASHEGVCSDHARHREVVAGEMGDLRREAAQMSERHESALEHRVGQAEADSKRSLEAKRAEMHEKHGGLQRDLKELAQQHEKLLHASQGPTGHAAQLAEHGSQLKDLARQQNEGVQKADEQLKIVYHQHQAGISSEIGEVRREIAKVSASVHQVGSEVEQVCRRWVDEAAHAQESSALEGARAQQRDTQSLTEAITELRSELQAARVTLSDRISGSTSRGEQLADEAQRQSRSSADDLHRGLEELAKKTEERFELLVTGSRHQLQEELHEVKQHVAKQLDEQLHTFASRISDSGAVDSAAARQADAEAKQRFDRLHANHQKTSSELSKKHDELARRSSDVAGEVAQLRSDLHGELAHRERTAHQMLQDTRHACRESLDKAVAEASSQLTSKYGPDPGEDSKPHDTRLSRQLSEHQAFCSTGAASPRMLTLAPSLSSTLHPSNSGDVGLRSLRRERSVSPRSVSPRPLPVPTRDLPQQLSQLSQLAGPTLGPVTRSVLASRRGTASPSRSAGTTFREVPRTTTPHDRGDHGKFGSTWPLRGDIGAAVH